MTGAAEVEGSQSDPVEAWGILLGEPECSLWAAAPAEVAVAALAEALGRERLRVNVAPDGRSIAIKSRATVGLNLVQLLNPTEFFRSPTVTVVTGSEGPAGTRIDVCVRGSNTRLLRGSVPRAMNRAMQALTQGGFPVTVLPWQRRSRFGRSA